MSGTYNKGLLNLAFEQNGFATDVKMTIIHQENGHMVTYYCGRNEVGFVVHGAQIWKRIPHSSVVPKSLDLAMATKLRSIAAEKTGFGEGDFCKLKPATCKKLK